MSGMTIKVGKVIAGWLILLFATQCKISDPSSDNVTETRPLSADGMQCTKIVPGNSSKYQEYILEKPDVAPTTHSSDCRVAGRFIGRPPGAIKVIIRSIEPETFKGFSECDRASVVPPTPDGSRQPLSEELSQLSFDSQISVSSYALSLQECLVRVLPLFRADRFSVVESISMQSLHFLNKKGGYDLSKAELPTAVTPVAVLRRDGKLHAIACAHFVYGGNQQPEASEIYKACLSNFADISAGEK